MELNINDYFWFNDIFILLLDLPVVLYMYVSFCTESILNTSTFDQTDMLTMYALPELCNA